MQPDFAQKCLPRFYFQNLIDFENSAHYHFLQHYLSHTNRLHGITILSLEKNGLDKDFTVKFKLALSGHSYHLTSKPTPLRLF